MSQLQVTGEAKIRDIQGPVVANDGVVTALDGAASQYVRGDGTLADFPTSSGGGSSVSYYLNSSVSQGTIGGVAYRELSKDPIIGAGTDIAISSNGYVANYITDVNDPDVTIVAGGNFNCEFYFSVNNNSGNPTTYAELYKYDGTTFTLLGSNVGVPESINQGTTIAPYYFAIPVATASLALTDRLAIRIYVNVSGRTVTLHTENGHLCQVVTTLSKGMVSLNNLTDQSQFLTTGTAGTNFTIASTGDTHTFNLPVASATNTGKLSSTDWTTFNNKQNTITDPITGTGVSTGVAYFNSGTSITSEAAFNYDASTNRLGVNTSVPNATIGANAATDSGYSLLVKNDNANYNGIGFATDSTYGNLIATEKLGTALTRNLTLLNQSGYISLTEAGNLGVGILTPNTGLDIYNGTSAYLWLHTANSGVTSTDGVRLALFSTNGANLRNYEGAFSITAEGDFSIITIGAENFRVNSADGSIYQSKVANAMLKSVSGVITAAVANTDYQSPITLTTSGSSGASTFTSNTLNVPNYTLSGLGGVPTSRTLTINGTAYDLSADRSWSVGTIGGSGVSGRVAYYDGTNSITSEAGFIYDASTNRLGVNTSVPNATIGADSALDSGYGLLIKTGSSNYNGIGIAIDSTYGNLISTEKLGTASARNLTLLNQSGFVSLKENGSFGVNTLNPAVSGVGIDIYSSTSTGIRFHTATSGTTVSDGAGINFSAGNNLGITNYEAGTIDIVTNGNSGVFIATNGYVGINGATPSVALTVNGAISQTSVTSSLLKTDSSGTLVAAVAGTDYLTPSAISGTTNYLVKFASPTTIGNSLFSEDGTNGSLGGTNYSLGTGVRTFNITAPSFAGIGFWTGTSQYTADIFAYQSTGNLILQADPQNVLSASNIILSIDSSTVATFNNTNVTLTRPLIGTSASFSSNVTSSGYFASDTYRDSRLQSLISYQGGNNIRVGSGTAADFLTFFSGAAERMSIATNGDTTIIGTAPILAIQSNTTGNIFLRFRQSADTMASMFYTNATATFTMSNNMGGLRFNTSGTSDALNISSTGEATFSSNVQTSQFFRSNTSTTNSITIGVSANTNYGYIGNSNFWGIRTGTSGDFNIDVNNSATPINAFKISQNGIVSIGTSNTLRRLNVFESIGVRVNQTGTEQEIFFLGRTGSGVNDGIFGIYDNGVKKVNICANNSRGGDTYFNGGGNVAIGTDTASYKLHVNGTAYATGAAGALSDIRHKNNVLNINEGLNAVMLLRPVSYLWNDDYITDNGMEGLHFGFIAQEVKEILPDVILEQNNEEKTLGLKYTELIPVLVKAIQELKAEIEELRQIVATK